MIKREKRGKKKKDTTGVCLLVSRRHSQALGVSRPLTVTWNEREINTHTHTHTLSKKENKGSREEVKETTLTMFHAMFTQCYNNVPTILQQCIQKLYTVPSANSLGQAHVGPINGVPIMVLLLMRATSQKRSWNARGLDTPLCPGLRRGGVL
jgi:hypothetical protein